MNLFKSKKRKTPRNIKVQEQYEQNIARLEKIYGKNIPCPFCDDFDSRQHIEILETMAIIENDFPYEIYGRYMVKKHLLLIPKRHSAGISDFKPVEREEYLSTISRYHSLGYASMTYSSLDTQRSVPGHLHTHLISLGDEV